MDLGRGWLFLLPLLAFVATAMLLSCGGGGGCGGSYDQFGNFVPGSGTCVNGPGITPAPPKGSIVSVSICPGAPPPPTPLPTTTATAATPTVAPTPCPFFTETTVPQGCLIQFHAVATLNNNLNIDITNDTTTNWTSGDSSVLALYNVQGVYSTVSESPSVDAIASAAGISSPPVAVTIGPHVDCPERIVPTIIPSPTPTPG